VTSPDPRSTPPDAPSTSPDPRLSPPGPSRSSILIVNYRAYDELDRCLASIDRHEPAAEVIVVDHDADDARARAVGAAHPRVRWVARRENPGFGAGVNHAARHAKGSMFVLVNPDVELREPILAALADAFARHADVGIVGGRVLNADGSLQPSARRFPDWTTAFGGRTSLLTRVLPGNPLTRRNLDPTAPGEGVRAVDWVTGAFMAMRREVFDRLGGFDEGFFLYWEDADFCRRAKDAGWRTLYDPAVAVVHAAARSSAHAPVRSLVAFHRSVFRYYWKHGGVVARACSPVVILGLILRLAIRALPLAGGVRPRESGA
jgi:GT2 family glycosyltransferase